MEGIELWNARAFDKRTADSLEYLIILETFPSNLVLKNEQPSLYEYFYCSADYLSLLIAVYFAGIGGKVLQLSFKQN